MKLKIKAKFCKYSEATFASQLTKTLKHQMKEKSYVWDRRKRRSGQNREGIIRKRHLMKIRSEFTVFSSGSTELNFLP